MNSVKNRDNYQYSNSDTSEFDLIMHDTDKMYFLSPKSVMFVIQNYNLFEEQVKQGYYDKESYKTLMSAYFMREYGWDLDVNNILYVPSDEMAYTLIFESLTKVNDNVVVLSPLEKTLRYKILASSRNLISIPLTNENGKMELDYELLDKYSEGAKVMVISNPHYPSGRCFTEDEFKRLGEIARKNNLWLLSIEEGYEFTREGISYTPLSKALGNSSNIITYLSPSKTLNLMDSTMGNLVINNQKFRDFMKSQLDENSRFSINAIDVEIFNIFYSRIGVWISKMKEYVNKNFELFDRYLDKIFGNLHLDIPESGTLAFIDLSKYGYMPEELEYRILKNGRLTLKFGEEIEGSLQGKVAINMAYPREMIKEALTRIRKSLN